MEDIRPYSTEEQRRSRVELDTDNPLEWELADLDSSDDVPFHIPRD